MSKLHLATRKLGWFVSAGLAGLIFGGGFQDKPDKVGWLDINTLYTGSNLRAKNEQLLQDMFNRRKDLLDFVKSFPSMNADELAKLKALSTKDTLTPAEKIDLDKLKAQAQATTKQYDDLRQKSSPTAEDVTKLNDFGNRNAISGQARQQWQDEFTQELSGKKDSMDTSAVTVIKEAVAKVAKEQHYTLVFNENAAVYGAADLGPEVKKIVDKGVK